MFTKKSIMGRQFFDLTLAEYSEMEDREGYDQIIKEIITPNKLLNAFNRKIKPKEDDFWMMDWGTLIVLRDSIEDLFEAMETVYGIKTKILLQLNAINVFACFKWINDQLEEIVTAEEKKLHRLPTAKEKKAGIDNFQEFGYANSLKALRGNDVSKDEKLLKLPYGIIFRELCMNRVESEYQEAYSLDK